MTSHGFNYIRLRTFVDPKASDGYDKSNGYNNITHAWNSEKRIEAPAWACSSDFHYSDNWGRPAAS